MAKKINTNIIIVNNDGEDIQITVGNRPVKTSNDEILLMNNNMINNLERNKIERCLNDILNWCTKEIRPYIHNQIEVFIEDDAVKGYVDYFWFDKKMGYDSDYDRSRIVCRFSVDPKRFCTGQPGSN